ncbi:MAG: SDR family oxidoreductase [Bacteroidota bacterium]
MRPIQTISILGAGWLGMPLGEKLAKAGFNINGSTTRTEKIVEISKKGMNAFLLDIDQEIKAPGLEKFFNCDLLFVNLPPRRRDPDILTNYPHKMTLILDQVKAHQIPYCIFISSTSVYGAQNGVVTEETPTIPSTNSGKALVQCEQMFLQTPNCQTSILRMSGLAGGNRKAGRFLAGKKDLPNGQGKVNLVHLEDCIGVIEALIEQQEWQEIFNVCADLHPTRKALYTTQAGKLGLEPPSFLADSTSNGKVVSNEKVKKVLGYQFQWPDPMQF